jgi:uncharacterized protein YaiI (UPF0178 family)
VKIWIDADACPAVIKEILFRAAQRTKIEVTLVANKSMKFPNSAMINLIVVAAGSDVADQEIVKRMIPGDLVVTADIPLADEVISKGGHALNPRGELYTPETIKAKLNMRDFMDSLRSSGIETGGPATMNKTDRQNFANQLDTFLRKWHHPA